MIESRNVTERQTDRQIEILHALGPDRWENVITFRTVADLAIPHRCITLSCESHTLYWVNQLTTTSSFSFSFTFTMTDVLGVHFDPDTVYINIARKCADARQK